MPICIKMHLLFDMFHWLNLTSYFPINDSTQIGGIPILCLKKTGFIHQIPSRFLFDLLIVPVPVLSEIFA